MRATETNIEGLYVIQGLKFPDLRGHLFKPFSANFFDALSEDCNLNFKETWFTKSHRNVVRAMHLQVGEFACEKLVAVVSGAIQDVVLDIRKNSPTFGQWFDIKLSEENPQALYIPIGCAHGYRVLEDNSITLYMATQLHVEKDDVGIRWNSFGYEWGVENPILSEKDKILPLFGEL